MEKLAYNPKVTIVIPAYNASEYLAEAIDSALSQTYANIEIIVVNDGSKDGGKTASVALLYGDKIRYIEKENGGSSSALNCGIKNMTGEWFSWLSHDDLYYPEKVEKQVVLLNKMRENGVNPENCCVFGASDIIDFEGKFLRKSDKSASEKRAEYINGLQSNLMLVAGAGSEYCFNGCTCFIHKTLFERIGYFSENLRLVNDIDMWKRIFKAEYKICYVSDSIVKGRMHKKQISASIGFSYHNPEQDEFWQDSLVWLGTECDKSEDYTPLEAFSKAAFSRGRSEEGKSALKIILSMQGFWGRIKLRIKFAIFRFKNFIKRLLKKIYRKLFVK